MKKILSFIIILVILIIFIFSCGCINNNSNSNTKKEQFLVTCGNGDIISHNVHLIIIDNTGTEIENSTYIIEPKDGKVLYRNDSIPKQEYTVIVNVDDNWTDSINPHPSSTSNVEIALGGGDSHDLFISHKD